MYRTVHNITQGQIREKVKLRASLRWTMPKRSREERRHNSTNSLPRMHMMANDHPEIYGRFNLTDTHWTGDWVGPRGGLGALDKTKKSLLLSEIHVWFPGRSSRPLVSLDWQSRLQDAWRSCLFLILDASFFQLSWAFLTIANPKGKVRVWCGGCTARGENDTQSGGARDAVAGNPFALFAETTPFQTHMS